MKRRIYRLLALVLALGCVFALASCGALVTPGGESDGSGVITIAVGGDSPVEYKVDIGNVDVRYGLISVLEYLRDEQGLDFKMSGTMIDRVGVLGNNAERGEYIYIYTSVPSDMDVSEYAETVEYKGQTLTSSGVGAGDMHIKDGAVIYIGIVKWK